MSAGRTTSLLALVAALASACVIAEAPDPVATDAAARTGGTLTVAVARPGAIDPANAFDPSSELIARTMCDTLLRMDPVTGELRPGLAETWLVTDEGRQLVLRLRADVTFTDGTPLTARDVVASLSRAASPSFAGEVADLLRPIAGWDELRGLVETDVTRHRRELAGVSAVGERAVQITLREADADFVTVLTHPVAAPVSADAVAADPVGFSEQPVCVGPYVVTAPWNRGSDVITLERTAAYPGDDPVLTGGGSGWFDRIVFRVTTEQPTPENAPDPAPDGDIAAPEVAAPSLRGLDVSPIAPEAWTSVGQDPAFEVITVDGPGVDLVGLPVPAGADASARAVRQALSLALDRDAIARSVGGRAAATGFLPPTVGPAFRHGACSTAPASPDPSAAKATLAGAGVDLGSLRLVTTDEFRNLAITEAVAQSWRDALDLTVEVEVVDWAELQRRSEAVDGFDAPFRTSWSQAVPSGAQFLRAIASSAAIGTTNWSRFSDTEVDDALSDDVGASIDREDLILELHAVEDALCEQLPLIPVVREVRGYAVRAARIASARADGAAIDRATALPSLRDLYARP